MSLALYTVRLFWDGRSGAALFHGRCIALSSAPVLPGLERLRLDGIDYAPEACTAQLCEYASAYRDMTREEIHAAQLLLQRLADEY